MNTTRLAIKQAQKHYLTLAAYAISGKEKDARFYQAESEFNTLVFDHGLEKHNFSIFA